MLCESAGPLTAFVFHALLAPHISDTVWSVQTGQRIPTASTLDFPGQPCIVAFAAILERGILGQLVLDGQPEGRGDAALVGRNHQNVFLPLAALVQVTAKFTCEQFRRAFDFRALGLEIFVNIHIGLDVNRISQKLAHKAALQCLSIHHDFILGKIPGNVAVGVLRLGIHFIHKLGVVHLSVFNQPLCFDTVHDDGLRIKTVWSPAPHIVALGTPGIKSVLHTHLDAFPFQLGEHDADIEHRPAHRG